MKLVLSLIDWQTPQKRNDNIYIHICITLPLSPVEQCRLWSISSPPSRTYSVVSFFAAHFHKCMGVCGCWCVYLWSLTLKQLDVDLSVFMAAFQAPEPSSEGNPLIDGSDSPKSHGVHQANRTKWRQLFLVSNMLLAPKIASQP